MPETRELIFYDGYCGLCHRSVKRVLRADASGELFEFAPLQGDYIKQRLDEAQRAALPNSIVVECADGTLLTRSSAVIHILERLGGWHRALGRTMRLIPRPVRDLGYRAVAAVRHKLFARPSDACPMVPPEQRARFHG